MIGRLRRVTRRTHCHKIKLGTLNIDIKKEEEMENLNGFSFPI